MSSRTTTYTEPLALIIISSISIGIAALVAIWIALDIALRRGWKSMMAVMIPVYILNALYLWPITLWTYLKYGRPSRPSKDQSFGKEDHQHSEAQSESKDNSDKGTSASHSNQHHSYQKEDNQVNNADPARSNETDAESQTSQHHQEHQHQHNSSEGHEMHHMHHASNRPMFATVTIAVCHCGAGCVLGDVIGEWIVYGTGAMLGQPPRALWVEYLVDFAFAFALGIVFQYFSIAPMAGEYGPKILYRALKADVLSLLSFEIGLFGWMAAFQIGIFGDQLPMNTVTYWWMMQIGMFIGHWTGVPVNWWLIKSGIKEPCA